jgi:hypothetical protein
MITHANGNSGYVPNDEAYEHIGYEILVTPFQPGVEQIVIDGLLELFQKGKVCHNRVSATTSPPRFRRE